MQELERLQIELNELDVAYQSYQSIVQKVANDWMTLMHQYLSKRLEDMPDILRVEWVQYTPYFNDGDECHFGVHEVNIVLFDPNELNNDYTKLKGINKWDAYIDLQDEINSIIRNNFELMERVFGESSKVKFVRDCAEFDIDYLDHE